MLKGTQNCQADRRDPTGSPYALYLGSWPRLARLQAEHMRLCLNSFALKSGPDEDEMIAQCRKRALDAAVSTIQTHYKSSQTDLVLTFATDVCGVASLDKRGCGFQDFHR